MSEYCTISYGVIRAFSRSLSCNAYEPRKGISMKKMSV